MKTIRDLNLKNKTVLVRTGFDVPLKEGKIMDNHRIVAGLPTIQYLLKQNCKIIIIFHIGRPEGRVLPELSVSPVQEELTSLLGVSVFKAPYCPARDLKEMVGNIGQGEIFLVENLRFYKEEEENDVKFAFCLASLAQVFVQDAFSVVHRDHTSVTGIPRFLPTVAGLLLEKEVAELGSLKKNPPKPAIAIIGGAKTETKIPVIDNLLGGSFDQGLLGGVIANTFLISSGMDLKDSNADKDFLDDCQETLKKVGEKIVLPSDFIWNNQKQVFDIGPKTLEQYTRIIHKARTLLWNGPMGVFEESQYVRGTKKIAEAIIASRAKKIAGGGDTIAALGKFKLLDEFDFVSTGGGVMLEFLAGKRLPGLEVLK